MDSDRLIASIDDLKEIVRKYAGGEEGLTIDIYLGDAPEWLIWFAWLEPAEAEEAQEVAGVQMLRELSAEVESLRDVDGDLDRLVARLRVADPVPVAPEQALLDALRTHCNSAIVRAPRDIDKEAREIGLLGQDLMRDVRDGFAPELAPGFIGRAEALKLRIAHFLAISIMIHFDSKCLE